jgi:glycosyltransferase involved in cell wall biosynthesis
MQSQRPVVVCFGPGPAFKGGIANYNTSLALAMHAQGAKVHIVSWTQQYPAIIPRDFKDRASKNNLLEGTDITVHYLTNYNNPFTWAATVKLILELEPQQVILQWALSIQGIPLGYIAKKLKKSGKTEVIFDCHLVVQKEGSALDAFLTRKGIRHAHTYVTHAYKTVDELRSLFPQADFLVNESGKRAKGNQQTVIKLYHPVYDLFKPSDTLNIEAAKQAMGLKKHVFLFFGFIRKYKGLHQAIEAFEILSKKRDDVSLLIVGESFWNTLPPKSLQAKIKKALFSVAKKVFLKKEDDEKNYQPLDLIKEKGLEPLVFVNNAFVPNEEVPLYFQVSDAILLFYLTATPSGVESLSYNFSLPVLASKVGHFPETIVDGYNGYLAADRDIEDMARVMEKSITNPIPRQHIIDAAQHLSWQNYAAKILHGEKA